MVDRRLIPRAGRAVLGHVGGFGLFALVPFAAFAGLFAYRGAYVFAVAVLVTWYVQSRLKRTEYKDREAARELVNELEDREVITMRQASTIRRGLRT